MLFFLDSTKVESVKGNLNLNNQLCELCFFSDAYKQSPLLRYEMPNLDLNYLILIIHYYYQYRLLMIVLKLKHSGETYQSYIVFVGYSKLQVVKKSNVLFTRLNETQKISQIVNASKQGVSNNYAFLGANLLSLK